MSPDLATVLATLALYVAIVVSPGPSFALVSRLAAAGERRAAFGATLGLALAAVLYAVLTLAGVSAVLAEIGWLARAVQVAGGLYLLHLGIQTWRGADRPLATPEGGDASRFVPGLRRGFLMCLSNPKAIAFFVGLFAAAVPPGTAPWAKAAIVAGAFLVELAWYGLVTLALSGRRARALYARARSVLERVMGAVLAAFGLRFVLERA